MIYMDNHATTRVDPRVLEAMLPYFGEKYGNAASRSHAFGWIAEKAVERAREQVAAAIGATPAEVVFTSGATESDNLALKGALELFTRTGDHVVTVRTEHKAVLDTCRHLEATGRARVTYLAPGPDGLVDPAAVAAALEPRTVLVAVMAANNETGTLQPLEELGALCHARGVLFFTDAAQAAGKVPLDVEASHVDLCALSAHKVYGPKGVGALYVRRRAPRVRVAAQLHGGGHERGMRSGTLPVPLVVGFGAALELAVAGRDEEAARLLALRERLWAGLSARLPGVRLNGHPTRRLPGNLNVSFEGVQGDALMTAVREVAVSSGAACSSADAEPSHVLRALGLPDEVVVSSIRFGLGRFNTAEEVDRVVDLYARAVPRLREVSGVRVEWGR
jgi:cysteine desulfurase